MSRQKLLLLLLLRSTYSTFSILSKNMPGKRPRNALTDFSFSISSKRKTVVNDEAESIASGLGETAHYLTKDGKSWYILKKLWQPSSKEQFEREWALHPDTRHTLKVYGRTVQEKRWSQSWGVSYRCSGAINVAKPLNESDMVTALTEKCNLLVAGLIDNDTAPYNGCLQNWYGIDDTIGLHADDEKAMKSAYPIFSLSWGGTRRFLFRAREGKAVTELWLKDGDLLVMGGTCQTTHMHEVPLWRKTMDPPTSNRINYTIRAFRKH